MYIFLSCLCLSSFAIGSGAPIDWMNQQILIQRETSFCMFFRRLSLVFMPISRYIKYHWNGAKNLKVKEWLLKMDNDQMQFRAISENVSLGARLAHIVHNRFQSNELPVSCLMTKSSRRWACLWKVSWTPAKMANDFLFSIIAGDENYSVSCHTCNAIEWIPMQICIVNVEKENVQWRFLEHPPYSPYL